MYRVHVLDSSKFMQRLSTTCADIPICIYESLCKRRLGNTFLYKLGKVQALEIDEFYTHAYCQYCMNVKKRKKKYGPSKTLSYFDLHYRCPFDRIILNQNLKERNSKGFDMNWLILRN